MKQSEIIVNGLLTNYVKTGKGKTVLLLHGWADSLTTFTSLIEGLQKDYTVIAVDLPGFGKSQVPNNAWDLSDYADWLAALIKKLDIRPYAVIGHSNGGALAIHAIAMRKLSSEKAVLLASSGVRSSGGVSRLFIKFIAKSGKLLTFWLPPSQRRKLQKVLYGTVGSDMLVSPHMQETFKKTVRQDVQNDAAGLDLPVLLLYGTEDRATPAKSIGQRFHKLIKNSQFAVLPHSGHFIHQDADDQVQKQIKEFLS